ncbi:hypothetical protein [Haliscomenobacter hydrossis]|uniref:Lipoprotein n=1 Tax=Haliscomenobacter hydrossis (strain ATCC 27775 / DSM 1100 / LMG 10767 / O) TaxID=760192 RepID=F4KVS5_HALH1|nr:hypothetical protein [Haliscomenobacter hydrossis]AEE53500.1 hypothetical protein Halhy_5677 [Haliscomenobacter hydrossis DSM 1100]
MRKPIFILAVAMLTAGSFFTSCQTPAEKVDTAETNVDEAQQDLKDAKQEEITAEQRAADAEEWTLFQTDTEVKIKANETRIAELRAKKRTSGTKMDVTYSQRIDTLEQRNVAMRTWLNDYDKSGTDWAIFKREFNRDMDELGQALKNLTVDNKN